MLSTVDEALAKEARAGDRLAFETLLQPLISPAYRLALVVGGDAGLIDGAELGGSAR